MHWLSALAEPKPGFAPVSLRSVRLDSQSNSRTRLRSRVRQFFGRFGTFRVASGGSSECAPALLAPLYTARYRSGERGARDRLLAHDVWAPAAGVEGACRCVPRAAPFVILPRFVPPRPCLCWDQRGCTPRPRPATLLSPMVRHGRHAPVPARAPRRSRPPTSIQTIRALTEVYRK